MNYFLFAMASPCCKTFGVWRLAFGVWRLPQRGVEHETTNPRADKQKRKIERKKERGRLLKTEVYFKSKLK
jgi:hypothetical protein